MSGTLGTVAVRLDDKKQSRWISEANEGRRDAHRDLWVFGLCSILKQNLLNVILRKKVCSVGEGAVVLCLQPSCDLSV